MGLARFSYLKSNSRRSGRHGRPILTLLSGLYINTSAIINLRPFNTKLTSPAPVEPSMTSVQRTMCTSHHRNLSDVEVVFPVQNNATNRYVFPLYLNESPSQLLSHSSLLLVLAGLLLPKPWRPSNRTCLPIKRLAICPHIVLMQMDCPLSTNWSDFPRASMAQTLC